MAFTWKPTNAPQASSRTDDIWFLDEEHGWAVNSNGQALYTADGGSTWAIKHVFPPENIPPLRYVRFAEPRMDRGALGPTSTLQDDGRRNDLDADNEPAADAQRDLWDLGRERQAPVRIGYQLSRPPPGPDQVG